MPDTTQEELGKAVGDTEREAYIFPLSYAQQRLWLLSQIETESPAYHICDGFLIRGPLDVAVLARSLAGLVERHEALRTTFSVMDGEPVQVVTPEAGCPLPRVDLRALDGESREREWQRLATAEARRLFDLVRGPLVRFTLVELEPQRHLLLVAMHHLIADGWSETILAKDLFAIYQAGGDGDGLDEIEIQYGDYAQWEREVLEGELLETLLGYWKTQLDGASGILELPADRPRPEEPSYRGTYLSFTLPEETAQKLLALARAERATPYALFLAAFGLLLGRWSNQDDVTVGSPSTHRGQVELEGLIGLFLNTLVLRVDFRGNPTFRELLGRVRETVLGAQEHQDLPFEKLVAELRPERDRSRSPFFQVLFNFENIPPRETAAWDGLSVETLQISTESAKLDLILNVLETPAGLEGSFEYSTDLFEHSTIERLLASLNALLSAVAADPDRRVNELPLLSPEARQELLTDWNATRRDDFPAGAGVHELVARRAAERGDAVAVRFGETELSFRQLEERSNQWAHLLRREGAGAGSRVGVYLDRRPELVVALLAVLKAGAAYLPIDPEFPPERVDFLLDDAEVSVVVAEERFHAALGTARRLLSPDSGQADAESTSPPEVSVHPDELAYVIYTSGSTGRPKGVMAPHRGVVNYLSWCLETYPAEDRPGSLVHGSVAFDMAVTSLFLPLVAGRTVVLLPQDADVETLGAVLGGAPRFNLVKLTPSHVEILNRSLSPEAAPGAASALILGGEALGAESLSFWRTHAPSTRLINEYGPTETVVGCAVYETAAEDAETGPVPIGRPIANTRLYVLDRWLQGVPAGTPGELYVGGVQVTRGYLGRPALSAERFLPDPFCGEPGARLYKTGDLVRRRADGNLEYLGRGDDQLKVHGWRVEPGEIEAALREHPRLREAAVLAHGGDRGSKRLVAYVVLEGEAKADELRDFLLGKLPQQMVPASFVALEKLPLTSHGKLDRQALPAPEEVSRQQRPKMGQEFVAPRDVVEDTLAAIYSQVLGVDEVGVNDNFFTLGGDSIRSLAVVGLARQQGLSVSLRQVALFPTVGELAREIQSGRAEVDRDVHTEPMSLISDEDRSKLPEDVVDAYPLGSMQAGMLFHQELTPNAPLFHSINSHLHELPLDEEAFQEAVLRVTARHPNLRTSFALTEYSEPLQLVHRDPVFPVAFHDLRGLSEEEQMKVLKAFWEEEQTRPFDLSTRPQLRFHIHRRRDDAFQFTLTENHAIIDGWSLHTTFEEILTTYFALLEGEEPPEQEPLRTSFRDFVHLERRAAASPEHREYWEGKMSGYKIAQLPRRPGHQAPATGHRVWRRDTLFPPKLIRGLRRVARQEAVPLKSVLIAAHLRVMSFLAGQNDIATGLSSNGRLATADSDRVGGVFLNTLPLRLRLGGGTWKELIHQTHEAELEMLPYRRYPLASIQKSWGLTPIFDTSVVYLNFHVMGELVRSKKVGYVEAGDMIEETNFAVMTAFLHVPGSRARVALSLCCDRWVFEDEQILEIEGYYMRALEAIVEDPAARYENLSLLSETESERILKEWNAPREELSPGLFHERFERCAAEMPERPALLFEDTELSYGELDRRSNQLARHLRGLGVAAEARVALGLERSADTVVAILAVLKAGGAYVPLDLSHPDERLAHVVTDSGALAVLTHEAAARRFAGRPATVVRLDADAAEIGAGSTERLGVRIDPAQLAYVVYTSGTTGRSKGVGIEHRQLASYLESAIRRLDLPPEGRYGLVSTFAADLGNTMIFPALAQGGTLEVFSEKRAADPAALAELAARRSIDCLKIVPSHLGALLSFDEPERILPRRRLVMGGEALRQETLEQVRLLAPECEIFNHYGPTEATVGAIAGRLDPADGSGGPPPLGRPLSNARIYVVDGFFEPVPAGASGELVIGGDGVARGYQGQPALTAEKFVPDPWSGAEGARGYRTGDLARHREDGQLEFLGRIDHQVKIRGFRVELGEIEAALHELPELAEAAVLAHPQDGETTLVAYVVARDGSADEASWRGALAEKLPDYMTPSVFVPLEKLPLTANGKLDRAALPVPGARVAVRETGPVAPRTEVEEKLVDSWKKILKVDDLGIFDSFFQLGGDSIKSIVAISHVRKLFGVSLPMESLFEAETVAGLAGRVEMALQREEVTELSPVERLPRDEEPPLSLSQQRLWYLWMLHPDSPAYNVPYAFLVRGPLDVEAWSRSLSEIVRRHEVLRCRFPAHDGEPRLVIDPEPRIEVTVHDLRSLDEEARTQRAGELGHAEAWRPFDLENGPLLRPLLIRLAEEEHAVLLNVHHIAFDGWSIGVFMRELETLYDSFRKGEPSPLEELSYQYPDFAFWQRRELQGERLEEHMGYWRRQLAEAPVLDLPTDRPRPKTQTYEGSTELLELSRELTGALQRTSRHEGGTLFMTLLCGFVALLHHRSKQEDVVVGVPVAAARDRAELEGLIGLFLNTLPLRGDLSGDPSFRELLGRIRRVALDGYRHQDVPFEMLVDELVPKRDLDRSPLFQVWFNHSTVPQDPPKLADLKLAPFDVGSSAVKFDLVLSTEEVGDRLVAWLGYNTDLFDRSTAEAFLADLEHILRRVSEDPGLRLSELGKELAEEMERRQAELRGARESARLRSLKKARRQAVALGV